RIRKSTKTDFRDSLPPSHCNSNFHNHLARRDKRRCPLWTRPRARSRIGSAEVVSTWLPRNVRARRAAADRIAVVGVSLADRSKLHRAARVHDLIALVLEDVDPLVD